MKTLLFVIIPMLCLHSQEWKVHPIDSTGIGADGIRLLDVNADGFKDIAVGWEEAQETRIYLHPGIDSVTSLWPVIKVGPSGAVEDAVFSDLDGNGIYDVISASESQFLAFHWAPNNFDDYQNEHAWSTQNVPASVGIHHWMFTVPIQIDGENGIDIIAAGKSSNIYLFESPKDARAISDWKMFKISDQGGWTMGMIAKDMDGDGDEDILISIRKSHPGVKWLENPGTGSSQSQLWKVHAIGEQGQAMGFVDIADLDGDGYNDVVSPIIEDDKQMIRIFRGLDSKGLKWESHNIKVPTKRNKGIAIGDMDLDGQLDLVMTKEFAEVIVLSHDGNVGEGHWTFKPIAKGGKFDNVTLYDVDTDGDLDILTTDERGLQVIWIENPKKS